MYVHVHVHVHFMTCFFVWFTGVVKNIIPAIASTNAIIAAACANEAFKLITFASHTMCDYHLYFGANGATANTFKWNKDEECMVCNTVDCNVTVTTATTLSELRHQVAKKMDLVEESITMNPVAEDLPDGVAPQLLWSDGPLADLTASNLPLSLADLNYQQFEGAIYLGATANLKDAKGGGDVGFNVVLRMQEV